MNRPAPPPDGCGPARVREHWAQALAEQREMDPAGALAVADQDELFPALLAQWTSADPELLWLRMADRLEELAAAARCLGCGTCCRASSPTLYQEDLALVTSGRLPRSSLYTLRAGEMGFSHRLGGSVALDQELIKLRESPGGGCLHLAGNRCSLYQSRPLQCRHLECWSGRHAGQLAREPRLSRADLLAGDDTALQLMAEYDIKLPAAEIRTALRLAVQGDAAAGHEALAALELDHRLRAAISQRYGYSTADLELILGRDLIQVARGHGLVPELDKGDNPRLVKAV